MLMDEIEDLGPESQGCVQRIEKKMHGNLLLALEIVLCSMLVNQS